MWGEVRHHLEEHGRDPGTFPVAVYHNVNIGPDRDACLEEAGRFFDQYYGPGFIGADAARFFAATGSVDQCCQQLVDLIDQGATHIMLRIASFDQDRHWEPLVKGLPPSLLAVSGRS